LPLPTDPPYTAFVGNLAFDLTEADLEEFFAGHAVGVFKDVDHLRLNHLPQTKSIKIIKDREDKPKGFGYVEFAELDGLKDALAKSGNVSCSIKHCRVLLKES
jgi:translation initiation factor 4B